MWTLPPDRSRAGEKKRENGPKSIILGESLRGVYIHVLLA
jgi:hypothetical protein